MEELEEKVEAGNLDPMSAVEIHRETVGRLYLSYWQNGDPEKDYINRYYNAYWRQSDYDRII